MRVLLAIAAAAALPAVHHTRAGTAAAQAALLRASDLGKGWSGKASVQRGVRLACPGYAPSGAGIVEVGGAASPDFSYGTTGPFVSQETSVYATAAEARTYWARAVRPGLLACVAQNVEALAAKGAKVAITRRETLPFSSSAPRAAAYRVVARVNRLTLYFDVILLGSGRAIAAIAVSSFEQAPPAAFEQILAHDLAARLGPQAA